MLEQLVKAEDAIWRRIGDEVVVIRDDGLSVHVLNKTAAVIWELYCDSNTVESIARTLSERFEVTLAEATADVSSVITDLAKLGLLKISAGASR